MTKGIKKTGPKPEETKEPVQAIDYSIEGPGPSMPSEEEQEALRISLRDSVNGKPAEDNGEQGHPFEAEIDERRRQHQEQAIRERAQAIAAADSRQGGLHHGYPPHSPGEGIQGGVATSPRTRIGRIVHFASDAFPDPVPAIITKVHSETVVDLTVFRPPMDPAAASTTDDEGKRTGKPVSGFKVARGVESGVGRRWFWPPRD